MAYQIDETLSPIYILRFDTELTLEQTRQLFAEVDVLLARPGKFGVVMNSEVVEDETDEELEEELEELLGEEAYAKAARPATAKPNGKSKTNANGRSTHKPEPGQAKLQKAWLVANRDRFEADCVGMAMVSPSSKFVSFYAPFANKIISRMYRCPGALFGEEAKALAWVQARMPETAVTP